MNQMKIAFFDIDGTILDSANNCTTMTEKMVETLKRLKEKGVLLCIATGRPVLTLPKLKEMELFDAYLTFNGSYCYTNKEVIYKKPIPHEDVIKIIENAKKLGRPVSAASITHMEANGIDKDLADYHAIAKENVKVSDDFDALCRQEIYQIMMGCRETEYNAVLEGVKEAKITVWWESAVDIIPIDNGKANGISHMLAYFGIDKSEAIAFGDGGNDMDMLAFVGTGVAMGNAPDKVKAVADEVCGTVAEDGIYHYCVEHGLF